MTPGQEVIELEFENEEKNIEKIRATIEHPFWVRDRGWIAAYKLSAGDEIFTSAGGWLKVTGSTWLSSRQTVYNFEVRDIHNYFVGKAGAWVHNMSRIKIPKPETFVRYGSKTEAAAIEVTGKGKNLVPRKHGKTVSKGAKWISEKGWSRDAGQLGKTKNYTHEFEIIAKPGTKNGLMIHLILLIMTI